jgi:hypothetical protein
MGAVVGVREDDDWERESEGGFMAGDIVGCCCCWK